MQIKFSVPSVLSLIFISDRRTLIGFVSSVCL